MLRKMLEDRLDVTPIERNGKMGVRFEGKDSYGGLLSGEVGLAAEGNTSATSHRVPRGNFLKYIPLDPLQHAGLIVSFEGRVAA